MYKVYQWTYDPTVRDRLGQVKLLIHCQGGAFNTMLEKCGVVLFFFPEAGDEAAKLELLEPELQDGEMISAVVDA